MSATAGWCEFCGDERPCECDDQLADEVGELEEEIYECDKNNGS